MTAAYIVWNADKTEGVIFVHDPSTPGYCQTARQDALQAATGERYATACSSLAEAFSELYDEGDSVVIETTAEKLREL